MCRAVWLFCSLNPDNKLGIMKLSAVVFAVSITAIQANAADRTASNFEFQGVALNANFSTLESKWLKGCIQSRDTRRDFCLTRSVVGEIPVTVEIGFLDGYVNTIYVSFPRTEYETIVEALRIKYGKEAVASPIAARWWSHSPGGNNGLPDSIVARKNADPKPKPDGVYWLPGKDYSEITYTSSWVVNNPLDSEAPEQKKKIQETSRGL
jgi:hypothetical protein